jgi:cytochrome P450
MFTQLDHTKHAAMRQTLNPAFRMDYLKQLDSVFVETAGQLAKVLSSAAADADADSADWARSVHSGNGQAVTAAAVEQPQIFDMQKLFKLMTLDAIGLTSMSQEFHALATWQQQQQQQQQGSSTGFSSFVDLEQMLVDLNSAFFWQALQLPVPRE